MPVPPSSSRVARATGPGSTTTTTATTTLSRTASITRPNGTNTARLNAGRSRAQSHSQALPPQARGQQQQQQHQQQQQAKTQELGSSRPTTTTTTSAGGAGSSDIAKTTLFVTNLRLLELDQSPSWPGITSKFLAGGDQKMRIAAVEWALFHLFQIYDEEETRNKLSPFFPPLEPLQSLNLRAALLRCLTELKRTGRLGRDVVLRKTMLDECKGDLLEDLLLVFSSLVLKKRVQEAPLDMSIALRLATAERLSAEDIACLQPLIIAHKISLSRTTRVKAQLAERYGEFCNLLDSQQESLQKLEDDVREAAKTLPERSTLVKNKEDRLRDMWQLNWMGDKQLLKQILRGNIERDSGRDLLGQPFDSLIGGVRSGRTSSLLAQGGQRDRPKQICDELEQRLKAQEKRLKSVSALQEELETRKRKLAADMAPTMQPTEQTEVLKFTAHKTLNLDAPSRKATPKVGAETTLQDRIDDLASRDEGRQLADDLENMLKEMKQAGLRRKAVSKHSTAPKERRPNMAHNRTTSKNLKDKKRSTSPDYTSLLTSKPTPEPEPKQILERAVLEDEESEHKYQIQAGRPEQKSKTEMRHKRLSAVVPAPAAASLTPAAPAYQQLAVEVSKSSSPESSSAPDSPVSSPETKSANEVASSGSETDSHLSSESVEAGPDSLVESKADNSFMKNVVSSSSTPLGSLTDRTRMTLSNLGPLPPSSPPFSLATKPQQGNKETGRRDTLQVPQQDSQSRRSSGLESEGQDGDGDGDKLLSGQRTPKEEVFASNDYASVFKSRPRLAHSPAFELREEDTLPNIDDSFALTEAGAAEESSPLARMQRRR